MTKSNEVEAMGQGYWCRKRVRIPKSMDKSLAVGLDWKLLWKKPAYNVIMYFIKIKGEI